MMQNNLKLKVEIKYDLAILVSLSFLFTLSILFLQLSVGRVILGLLYLMIFPGYALTAALFPRSEDLDSVERTSLSFGLSIVVVAILGIFLNYTDWGIQIGSVMTSVTLFIAVGSCIAYYRRKKVPVENRFVLYVELDILRWKSMDLVERILSVLLALSIGGATGMLVFVLSDVKPGESFTEFYILGQEGLAENFPREVVGGHPVMLTIGITNQETMSSIYSIAALIGPKPVGYAGPIELSSGEIWEGELIFVLPDPGDNQQVDILLEREGFEFPYRSLHLWMEVTIEDDSP